LSRENIPIDFDLVPIATQEVNDAQIRLNAKKSASPNGLDPFYLNIAAELIAEPLIHLTIENRFIPSVLKPVYVTILLKGGDRSNPNIYRPISKLSDLA